MEFKEDEKEHFIEIEILYDGQREMREAFTVHMKPDDNMVAELQVSSKPHGIKHTHTRSKAKQKPAADPSRPARVNMHLVVSAWVKVSKRAAAGHAVSILEPQVL